MLAPPPPVMSGPPSHETVSAADLVRAAQMRRLTKLSHRPASSLERDIDDLEKTPGPSARSEPGSDERYAVLDDGGLVLDLWSSGNRLELNIGVSRYLEERYAEAQALISAHFDGTADARRGEEISWAEKQINARVHGKGSVWDAIEAPPCVRHGEGSGCGVLDTGLLTGPTEPPSFCPPSSALAMTLEDAATRPGEGPIDYSLLAAELAADLIEKATLAAFARLYPDDVIEPHDNRECMMIYDSRRGGQ